MTPKQKPASDRDGDQGRLFASFRSRVSKPSREPPVNGSQQLARFAAPCLGRARGVRGSSPRATPRILLAVSARGCRARRVGCAQRLFRYLTRLVRNHEPATIYLLIDVGRKDREING